MAGLARAAPDSVCELTGEALAQSQEVQVREVFDGDTVQLADGRKVRLIGINTPELARDERPEEPLAREARVALAVWQGKTLRLLTGEERKDRYGRTLGHLFAPDGSNITAALLAEGLGFPVVIPPNVAFSDCYRQRAHAAGSRGVGVWHHGYHRLRAPSVAEDLQGGFGRYRGKIERVYITDKIIWIDFIGDLSVRVAKKDLPYLQGEVLDDLLKAVDQERVQQMPQLTVSGWVMDRTRWGARMARLVASGKRNRWQVNVRHRHHWQWSVPGSDKPVP
ncbi:MAG: thermonuclease family protein [Ketobacteraceae bacterium]|nr:thermonuclease family protein [Ketobacteraceae bacterium]